MPPASPPASRPQTDEAVVKAELIKIIFDGSPTTTGSGVVGAIVVATVFQLLNEGALSPWVIWGWAVGTILAMFYGRWLAWEANKVSLMRQLRFERRLVVFGGITGAVFAAPAWLFLPAGSATAEGFLIMAVSMVLMGGASIQAPHWKMLLTYIITFGAIFATGLARLGDRYHVLLGITFFVYSATSILFARNQEIAVRRQLLANLENQALRAIAEAERERADSASQAKTAFLAAASHDLRQPLHALVQYTAHLNREIRDPGLEDTVRCIGSSVDAMRGLLDSILDLSKLMVGGVQPVVTAFPIGSLLERLDAQLRPLATDKGLQFTATPSNTVVMSDDVLLERILRNLILNAIRYTNSGQVTIRCRQRRNTLQIQVWDTGIGIPRANLKRIFDPFFQVDNRARDRHKGLGLGLAIVRQLCDLLGYHIKVKTKIGSGTVFAVSVPVCVDSSLIPRPRKVADSTVSDYVRGAFVVLVDDDTLSRDASEHTLKSFGCRILAAASSMEAIAKLEQQEFAPQIIVADYRLEAETGIEAIQMVTETLRRLFGETFVIPALVVSGDTAPDELRRVNDHGYQMLHKPVATDDLWSGLNGLLERKALEREF